MRFLIEDYPAEFRQVVEHMKSDLEEALYESFDVLHEQNIQIRLLEQEVDVLRQIIANNKLNQKP